MPASHSAMSDQDEFMAAGELRLNDTFSRIDQAQFRLRKNLTPFVPYVEKRNTIGNSVLLDVRWIDISIIRSWLRTCDRVHGSHCQSADHLAQNPWQRPAWLIDVQRCCLVPGWSKSVRYFALSYVWGHTASTSATAENIPDLQGQNALKSKAVSLPRTIEDAISLVRALDGQYLWVDRLCIVQDGPEKEAQLSHMAAIYANSYATIVAAQGANAAHGLRGIRDISEPRNLSRHGQDTHIRVLRYNRPSAWASVDPSWDDLKSNDEILEEQARHLMQSEWYSRGWTFQEQLFSRRKIVFQGQTVNWECHCVCQEMLM